LVLGTSLLLSRPTAEGLEIAKFLVGVPVEAANALPFHAEPQVQIAEPQPAVFLQRQRDIALGPALVSLDGPRIILARPVQDHINWDAGLMVLRELLHHVILA